MRWEGQGSDYALSWAGLKWRLALDGPAPGLELREDGQSRTRLLSLSGLTARGRSSSWLREGATLTKTELLFDRIEATYQFPDWGGLSVRASWNLVPELDGIDLEVQILASSVDFLKAVEVQVVTQIDQPGEAAIETAIDYEYRVEPRDRDSAALTYDGREFLDILQRLWTLPISCGTGFAPRITETPWLGEGLRYVEFVHPDDVARRIERRPSTGSPGSVSDSESGRWTRYAVFGHDLEKGVLLRSRMRGFWNRGPITDQELAAKCLAFRQEPLPLGP